MVRQTQIVFICILFLFIGCSQQKRLQKQKQQAENYYLLNKPDLARLCAKEFPAETIQIVQGDTIQKTDTILVSGPKLICPDSSFVECPQTKIIKELKIITDTIIKIDASKIYLLQNTIEKTQQIVKLQEDENRILEKQLLESDKKKTKFLWILIALAAVNILYFIFKIKTFFKF